MPEHTHTHTHTGLMGGFSARQSSGSTSVLLLHGELLLQSLPELPLSEQLHLQLCLLQLHLLLLSPRVVNRHFEQALRAHTHTHTHTHMSTYTHRDVQKKGRAGSGERESDVGYLRASR